MRAQELPGILRRAAEPAAGAIFADKYQIESTIGQGGMGIVVKARHLGLDEHVAIKYLKPQFMQDRAIVARFEREGRAAAKLKGEHVIRIHDVGQLDGGVPYIVMEYVEGADLAAILKAHGAQHPSVCVDVIMQACLALAEAHSAGIVHRDIKPANFFITQRPSEPVRLKVLDFGIATAPDGINLTKPSVFIGTPAYVSPEQMRKPRDADARSDIWSLGIVLFEMLEGASPFKGRVMAEMYAAVCREKTPPMSARIPAPLQAIVRRCLEKDPAKRYQSASDLARDLAPHATDPVAAYAQLAQCRRLSSRGSQQHAAAEPVLATAHVPREAATVLAKPRAATSRRRPWIAASIGALVAALGCVVVAAPARFHDALDTAITAVEGATHQVSQPRRASAPTPAVAAPTVEVAVTPVAPPAPAPAPVEEPAPKPAPALIPTTTGAVAPVAPGTVKPAPKATARPAEPEHRAASRRVIHRDKITFVDEEDEEPAPRRAQGEIFERRR